MTVLFADVMGFTTMSEQLAPELVAEIVNQFFAVLSEPIYRYGGVVDKYIGDAIMALFGAPIAHEDDPERAVLAAYEMQQAAREFADSLERRIGMRLLLRIGLHTGWVVAGTMGGDQKRDYTVMGETVNLAHAAEANAVPGRVLVTRATYKLVQSRFEFKRLDPVNVRGKSAPLEVFELVRPHRETAPAGRDEPPFVGRAQELQRMQRAWQEASQGSPRLVILSGDPGLGKSRLAAQFVSRSEMMNARRLRARCQSYTQGVSFGVVASLLHDWLGTSPHASRQHLREALEERCFELDDTDPFRLADLLGPFVGLDSPRTEIGSLSQEQRRNAALHEIDSLLVRLSQLNPLLLSLEDLQWADEASLQWLNQLLDFLAAQPEPAPVLVTIQVRTGFDLPVQQHTGLAPQQIRLRAFEVEESWSFVAALLRASVQELRASRELADFLGRVLGRTEGNPLYLAELTSALVESGVLVQFEGSWRLAKSSTDFRLPTSLQGALAAHLDRLTPEGRHLLQVSSVLGRSFTEALLAEVAAAESPLPGLGDLIEGHFLYQRSQGDFAFTQALMTEVAYHSLLLSSRKDLHRRAGLALERLYVEHRADSAQVLAHHFSQAESFDRAFHYDVLAAQKAFDLYDLPNAQQAIDRAVAMLARVATVTDPERAACHYLAGQIHMALNQHDEALHALSQALRFGTDPKFLAETHQLSGDTYERMGQFHQALEAYHRGLDLLDGAKPSSRALFQAKVGFVHYRQGEFDECIAICQRAASLTPDSMPKEAGYTHSLIGLCYWRQGNGERAIHHTRLAMEFRQQAKDLPGIASSGSNLANIYADQGEMALAEQYYRLSLQAYERIGDEYLISLCHNNLGSHLLVYGDLDEAERHLRLALDLQRRMQTKQLLGLVLFNLGDAQAYRGEIHKALESMKEALRLFEELSAREYLPEVHRNLARVCAELGLETEARQNLSLASYYAEETGDLITPGVVARIEGELALAQGRQGEALGKVEEAIARLGDAPLELGRAYALKARILAGTAEFEQTLRAAEGLFQKLGAVRELGQAGSARERTESRPGSTP